MLNLTTIHKNSAHQLAAAPCPARGDYLSTLKQLIPEENIPTIFGGTSVVPDHYTSVGPWQAVEPCKSAHWLPKGARPSEPGPAEVSKAPADVAGAGHEVMVRAE